MIFDRFHQVGEVMSREQEGAGLGLYITKRLVEAMGGSIEVSSEPGRGSTFRVHIPDGLHGPDGEAEAVEVVEPVSARSQPGAP
jgi:signal transduction histidine kinase